MATLAGSALTAGCGSNAPSDAAGGEGKPAGVFTSVFDCVAKSGKSEQECRDAHSASVEASMKEAPRFAAVQECEAEWGAGGCVENQGEGERERERHYSPFPRAFMFIARSGGGSGSAYRPLYGRPGESGFRTANGARLDYGGAPGKYVAANRALEKPKSVPKVRAASAAAMRGGFGERSSLRLAGGSGVSRSFGG